MEVLMCGEASFQKWKDGICMEEYGSHEYLMRTLDPSPSCKIENHRVNPCKNSTKL